MRRCHAWKAALVRARSLQLRGGKFGQSVSPGVTGKYLVFFGRESVAQGV